jgi:predicted nucleic acid-binding protein
VTALIDTNILVYRVDPRFPEKQTVATDLLRRGLADNSVRVPHQAVIEFVAAVTRPLEGGDQLLSASDARLEAEDLLNQFTILYPTEAVVRTAVRAWATYGFGWFDAHLWAYAHEYGLSEIVSEVFQLVRPFCSVRDLYEFL